MAHEAIAAIEIVNVGAQHARQPLRQIRRPFQLHQDMKVIRHQAVMIEAQAEAIAVASQQAKKMASIVVIAEALLAVVTAIQNVVTRLIGPLLLPWCARHWQDPPERFGGSLRRLMLYFTHKSAASKRLYTVSPSLPSL
jgi:hypothetical protein